MRNPCIGIAVLLPLMLVGCKSEFRNGSATSNLSCSSKSDDLDLKSFSVRGTAAVSVPTQPEVIDSSQSNGAFTVNWQATSGYRFKLRLILSHDSPPFISFGRPPGVVFLDRDYGPTPSGGTTVAHSCQLTTDNKLCCDGSCSSISSEIPSKPQKAFITWFGSFNNGDDCQSAMQQSAAVELR